MNLFYYIRNFFINKFMTNNKDEVIYFQGENEV